LKIIFNTKKRGNNSPLFYFFLIIKK